MERGYRGGSVSARHLNDTAVLVTGGSGFLGRHVIAELVGQGAKVVTVARTEPNPTPEGTWVPAALRIAKEAQRCVADLRGLQCSRYAVVHLAGLSDASVCKEEPLRAFEHNVVTTANLLDAARRHDIPRFVLASTSYVYGDSSDHPFDESDPRAPASVYANTKYQAEELVQTYSAHYGLRCDILRLSTLYGAGASRASALGLALAQARHEKRIQLRDGSPVRDFLYVLDAARILSNLLPHSTDETCRTLNVGSGQPISLTEACQTLGRVAGLDASRVSFHRSGDPALRLTLNIGRLRCAYPAFRPTPLQVGLHESFTGTS